MTAGDRADLAATTVDTGVLVTLVVTFGLVALAVAVIMIIAMWRVFTKSGRPGWAAIIPFYNSYVLLKVVGRPGWWLVLLFIPLVNVVVTIIVLLDLATSFGKGTAFAIFWLIVFSFVGLLILGFGDARYLGPADAVRRGYQPPPGYPDHS